jgi:hypothetical protein
VRFGGSAHSRNAVLHNAFLYAVNGLHSVYNLPLDHRCVLEVVRNAVLHNAFRCSDLVFTAFIIYH